MEMMITIIAFHLYLRNVVFKEVVCRVHEILFALIFSTKLDSAVILTDCGFSTTQL